MHTPYAIDRATYSTADCQVVKGGQYPFARCLFRVGKIVLQAVVLLITMDTNIWYTLLQHFSGYQG